MSIVSGTVGAVLGSKAQNKATEANLRIAKEQNALNYDMFQQSRGSGGNAFLPLYFGDFEKDLKTEAQTYYNASKSLLGTPWEQANRVKAIQDKFMPMMDAADKTAAGIFDGSLTQQRRENFEPVGAARLNVASAQREASNTALQNTLNELKALQARAGFTGTGSSAQNRMLGARMGAGQEAALMQSNAELQNMMDMRSIGDEGIDMRMMNLNLPYDRARQAVSYMQMPVEQMQQNFNRTVQPFEFFRMGQQSFRNDQLPMQGAVPSAAQIALTASGQANSQLAQYYMNRNNANQAAYGNTLARDAAIVNYGGGYGGGGIGTYGALSQSGGGIGSGISSGYTGDIA